MNPNCGCIDKVVTINDIVHTLSYSSAVAFLSVGRILLEINSLIYTQNKIICFIVKYNKKLITMDPKLICTVCESQPQTLATLTLPLVQYHQRI